MKAPTLDLAEPGASLRRVLTDLACELEADLRAWPDRAEERAHDIRVRAKIIRALVRLFAPRLDPQAPQIVKDDLAPLKDAFASDRDRKIMIERVIGIFPGDAGILERLGLGADATKEFSLENTVQASAARLRENLQALEVKPLAVEDLTGECVAAYRRARKAMRRAHKKPTDAAMHEWRKRVKGLLYQVEALDALPFPAKMRRRLVRLAELLGDHHDLSLLSARFSECGDHSEAEEIVQDRKSRLARRARALGQKLFHKKPSVHAKKLLRKK